MSSDIHDEPAAAASSTNATPEAGNSPATTPTPSVSSTDSSSANESSTLQTSCSNAPNNGYGESNGLDSAVVEDEDSVNNNNGTTVMVTDPSASSGQNYVLNGSALNGGYGPRHAGGGSGGGQHNVSNHRASSPHPYQGPHSPHSYTPDSGAGDTTGAPGGLVDPNTTQHVVHVHINPGETFSVRVGNQMQHIQGPATVRMVSNNGPPLPMPMQVPPGHMVQQIVDENGYLTHVILSPQPAGMAAPAPPPPMTGGAAGTPQQLYGGHHGYGAPQYAPYPQPPQYTHHHHTAAPPHMHSGTPPPPPPQQHQTSCNNHGTSYNPGSGPQSSSHNHTGGDERTSRTKLRLQQKINKRNTGGGGGYNNNNGTRNSNGPASSNNNNTTTSSASGQSPAEPEYYIQGSSTSSPPHRRTHAAKPRMNGVEGRRAGSGEPCSSSSSVEETMLGATDSAESTATSLMLSTASLEKPKVSDVESRSALVKLCAPTFEDSSSENTLAVDLLNYELYISEKKDGKYKSVYNGNAIEITLKDLKPAVEYHLRVRCIYETVKGELTEAVSFKTHSSEPDPPQPVKLSSRSKTSLLLKWNATCDNGSKVLSYHLECDHGRGDHKYSEVYTGSTRQFKVTKLQASTGYMFRLAATNAIGKSGYGEAVCLYTSGSVPSQPDPPMMSEQFVKALCISWIKRPNDDAFTLQMEDEATGHGFLTVYRGPDLHHKINNLRRNTEYKFKLLANNEEGNSKASDTVGYRTLPDVPSPPCKLQQKGRSHPTSFRVTWDHPKDDGGSPITKYSVELDEGRGYELVFEGQERECVCDRLSPGHQYRVRASAHSAGGRSDWSDVVVVSTQSVAPSQCQPPKLQGKPKATSMHLKWSYPEHDGGCCVSEFEVQVTWPDASTRQVYRGRDTDCVVAGLLPGRPYLVQVRAINKTGAGPWSDKMEVISGPGVPDPPKPPSVTFKSAHSAVVQWDEPVNNGAAIMDYNLEWQPNCEGVLGSNFCQLYNGAAVSYEVRNLTPATNYAFRVQAVNSAGAGPYSAVVAGQTPASSPAPVLAVRASASATSIHLSWKEPATNGSPIIAYNVDLGEKHLISVDSSVTETDIDNLLPETQYKLRVQAVNNIGVGPFSSLIKVTTRSLPPAPPRLECVTPGPNSLKLKWGDGKNTELLHYSLEILKDNGSFYPVYHGTAHIQKVHKLQELRDYQFRICARNDAGEGPYSDIATFRTTKAQPPAVRAPRVTSVSLESAQVEWAAVKAMGSDTITYCLQMAQRDHDYKKVYTGSNTSHRLTGLHAKCDYTVRVCAIRESTSSPEAADDEDSSSVGSGSGESLTGAFSPGVSFTCLAPNQPNNSNGTSSSSVHRSSGGLWERRNLTDQQWAGIILVVFAIVAVLFALLVQKFVAYRSGAGLGGGVHGGGSGAGAVDANDSFQ